MSERKHAICDHGCLSASRCTGKCQSPILVRTGKRRKYCEMGERLTGDEHWILKSIVPARIDIRKCTAVAPKSTGEQAL